MFLSVVCWDLFFASSEKLAFYVVKIRRNRAKNNQMTYFKVSKISQNQGIFDTVHDLIILILSKCILRGLH